MKQHPENAAARYIDIKNRRLRLPAGVISEEFFESVFNFVRQSGLALNARPPGKFAQIPQLSLSFVPGNLFAEQANTYENCRYFVYELQEEESLRSIAGTLFQLYHHYPNWNFFIRRSNTSEMVFSSEEMYYVFLEILENLLKSEQEILKSVRNKDKKKRKNR